MQQRNDFLSAEQIQLFMASLSSLSPEERRKAKALYIRNAITDYHALKESIAGFARMQGCFSFIPVFWPVIGAQRRMLSAQVQRARERIANAIETWRDDLRGEHFHIDGEDFVA